MMLRKMTLDETMARLRADDLTEEEWVSILQSPWARESKVKESLLKHHHLQLKPLCSVILTLQDFEWIAQNELWPLLLETDRLAASFVGRNSRQILQVLSKVIVEENADYESVFRSVLKVWNLWLDDNFEKTPGYKESFYETFNKALENISAEIEEEMELNGEFRKIYNGSNYAIRLTDAILNFTYIYEQTTPVMTFRFCTLLEKEAGLKHQRHLLSFLEES